MDSLIVFIAGFGAALLGAMGGGGGGFVALYTLLLLGLPLNAAIATLKFGDLGFYPASLGNFAHQGLLKKRVFLPLVVLEIPGAIIGTLFLIHLSDTIVKYAMTLILALIFFVMALHSKKIRSGKANAWWRPVYFFGAFAEGAAQAGSFIKMYALLDLRKIPALQAAANRFLVGFPQETISVGLLLFFTKLVNVHLGVPLFAGNIIGGYFGSNIAIKRGNTFVRYVLLCLMVVTVITIWQKHT